MGPRMTVASGSPEELGTPSEDGGAGSWAKIFNFFFKIKSLPPKKAGEFQVFNRLWLKKKGP